MRQALEQVASTPSGEKVLKHLFLICGGDSSTIRRGTDQKISIEDTLIILGAKTVWETIRFLLTSDTLKKIERHMWEDNNQEGTT